MQIRNPSSPESARLGLTALILFVLLVCLPIRFWLGSVQMTGLRLYLTLLALPLVIIWLRDPELRRDPVAILLGLFVGWSAISISRTSPEHVIENTGSVALEMLCAYLLARLTIRTSSAFQTFSLTSAVIVMILLPFALLEARTGSPILIQLIDKIPAINSVEIVSIAPRLGLERAQVAFAHPIHFGLFACSTFALIAVGLRSRILPIWRVTLAGAAITATLLSLSSGPILALAIQIALLVWIALFGHRQNSWLALIAILLAAYITVDLLSNRTPLRVFMSYATFSPHNAFWRGLIFEWGTVNVLQNPIFGIGFNDWERPPFMRSGSIDNFWLAIAMKYGLPGFALLAAAVLAALWRSLPQGDNSATRLTWTVMMISLIFALCTVHVWTSIHAYFFFLLGAGQHRIAQESASKPAATPKTMPAFSRIISPVYIRQDLRT